KLAVDSVGDPDAYDPLLFLLFTRLVAQKNEDTPLAFGERRLRGLGNRFAVGPHWRGRLVAQGGARDTHGPFALARADRHRGGHAGAELLLGVVDLDDRRIGDHALHGIRAVAHLLHHAVEALARKGIDDRVRVHVLFELADIGFVHVGQD